MLTLSHYDLFTLVFRVQTFQKKTGMLGAQCLKGQWGEIQDPTARQVTQEFPHPSGNAGNNSVQGCPYQGAMMEGPPGQG